MSKEIELGDLEFKVEDYDFKSMSGMPFISMDKANRLLRERLAKAKEVQSSFASCKWFLKPYWWHDDTHRARLVCIEKIEEEK